MDILTFINSLTNEDLNRIRNSKSDAEARRLLREHQALQLQQTGVNGSFCSNCRWLNSCAIRIDYNVDTCEEHEF